MRKLYGNIKMTWLKVVIFAIIAGVYTGAVMLIPALKETSFQDIGITAEWWLIFGVIIAVNCKKSWESMLKCFVFFLISQPLVYLVQIIFGSLTFDMAWLYYRSLWLLPTFLTLPAGFIAYFCKKQNVIGAVILGIGSTVEAAMGVAYAAMTINRFPRHILTTIVCFGSIIVMTLCIQKKKTNRIIAIIVPIVLCIAILIYVKVTGRVLF